MKANARVLMLLALSGLAAAATAQTYRWTDPTSGRLVISNQPPPPGIKAERKAGASSGNADGASDVPFVLREPLRRFPVVLYAGPECKEGCDGARTLLAARGIPYAEKSVATREVLDELRSLSGSTSLPTLLVGRQATVGFERDAWNGVLDLAGYPQRPPSGYRPPPPVRPKPAGTGAETADAARQ